MLSRPFLLSSEQDELVKGLREAKFFDKFEYDAQDGAWFATDGYVKEWEERK